MKKFISSESVTEGHPDKLCDRISDSVLDAILTADPMARVACETCCTTGLIVVMGEISTSAYVDIQSIARGAAREVGFDRAKKGFDSDTCAVLSCIDEQSPDIALGVDRSYEAKHGDTSAYDIGAGDQGMMFGYACDETETLMPMPIYLAHRLSKRLAEVRKDGIVADLYPDGKTQVTVEYDDGVPVRIDSVVVSAQHSATADLDILRREIEREVIRSIIPERLIDADTHIFINPTGRFVVGGPHGDSGLTGRKIIADTYGGCARHGGGAFSGKDPTKVDRSASYMARYLAKNIVAAGIASRCEIQIAYAIGVAKPLSVYVDTFGTGKAPDDLIAKVLCDTVDLRPAAIIEQLDLRRPQYTPLSSYGHFGREELGVRWEERDLAPALAAKLL